MHLIIDVETTGLPKGYNISFKNLECYDNARIVSICWSILNENLDRVIHKYYIVKPDSFIVNEDSTKIHGITHEEALSQGTLANVIFANLYVDIIRHNCQTFVAHNVSFDFKIILSELYRRNLNKYIWKLCSLKRVCTMKMGKEYFNLAKFPKLSETYKLITNCELEGAHNASIDVAACENIYKHMLNNTPCHDLNNN